MKKNVQIYGQAMPWLLPLTRRELAAVVEAMLAVSPAPAQGVDVYLLRDGAMAGHNLRCLGCVGPTNVLSFPARQGFLGPSASHLQGSNLQALGLPTFGLQGSGHQSSGPGLSASLGDSARDLPASLLLAVDTLQRECFLYGQDASEHCVRLLAHGMGHIMGLDHGPEMDSLCADFAAVGEACVRADFYQAR